MALNGLILPAAKLCCAEIFLPFSVNNLIIAFILGFAWGGPRHRRGEGLVHPFQRPDNAPGARPGLAELENKWLLIILLEILSNLKTVEMIW